MTSRRLQTGGTTYTQGCDAENRLASVTGGGQTTTFTYDGDGKLVKKVTGVVTTVYVGTHFEKNLSTGVATSYYYAGGTRVAMRQSGVGSYLHGDHLGSASLATNASGAVVANSATRYYPYGKTRSGGAGMPTDYRFTGQRLDGYINLYFMGARWYDPALGRWISSDSVVPDPTNPQSLNRYSYVNNRPLNRVDPSGHEDIPPLMQQAIDYFTKLGWQVLGDASQIDPHWNGPDLVFFVNKDGKVLQVLATELKGVQDTVDLGTLGKSVSGENYGGSLERLANSTGRFYNSSKEQLRLMCRTVFDAIEAGKAENAIFTSAPKVSEGAQAVFDGVYRVGENGQVIVDKALKDPSFWTKVGAGASTAWNAIRSAGEDLRNVLVTAPILLVPAFILDPMNPQNPLSPTYGKSVDI